MRTRGVLLCAYCALTLAGCASLFPRHHAVHFRGGSMAERDVGTTLNRTVSNLQLVLRDAGIVAERTERGRETARVIATKDGRKYVADVSNPSEAGSRVHLEIDAFGATNEAESLLASLSMLP